MYSKMLVFESVWRRRERPKAGSMNEIRPAPMSLPKSLGFFATPWLLFIIAVYAVIPALGRANVPLFGNFFISLAIPLGLLLLAALVAYRRDGWPWTWSEFRCRFRLEPMRGTTWLWAIGLSVFMFLGQGFLDFTSAWIQTIAPIPDTLARMFKISTGEFMGVPLAGAWWMVLAYLAYIVINVSGEELWWRGYILPRQEASLGKWAWLVHGILWNLFHSFFYWELIMLLPGCLALSYVAHRSRSTWPGIIAHFASNIPGLVIIVIGVLR
jgi:membrane protease YdiL (CAAX protease family)